jgi:hypothetical protein
MRKADHTASLRVSRYRDRQAGEQGRKRAQVRINPRDGAIIQRVADQLRRRRDAAHSPYVAFVLNTINAPRPTPIDADTLLDCLLAVAPPPKWRPHLEALLTEVSAEALHRLVLIGFCQFEDLRRAASALRVPKNERRDWIDEMAAFTVARDAERHIADPGRS